MKIRDARKQASRARVVAAARSLFEEVGFQATTVRMIAERAQLSPGGVFTTFEDKVAILCQVLDDYREGLFDEIEAVVPTLTGSVQRRLEAVFNLAHAHELSRLRLVLAYIGASYTWSRHLEQEHRSTPNRLSTVLRAIVEDGVRRGEVRSDVDIDLFVDMMSSIYQRNYRTTHFAELSAAELDRRAACQLDLLFEGARPG